MAYKTGRNFAPDISHYVDGNPEAECYTIDFKQGISHMLTTDKDMISFFGMSDMTLLEHKLKERENCPSNCCISIVCIFASFPCLYASFLIPPCCGIFMQMAHTGTIPWLHETIPLLNSINSRSNRAKIALLRSEGGAHPCAPAGCDGVGNDSKYLLT